MIIPGLFVFPFSFFVSLIGLPLLIHHQLEGCQDERTNGTVAGNFVGSQGQTAARGRRVHDLHDPDFARELRADRPFRRPARLHALQRRRAFGRAQARRPAARLPPSEASLWRQIHARGRPLRADVLRAVDDHGRSAVPEVQGDRRQEVLRGAEGRLPRDRRARFPPRRRRVEDAASGPGARQRPALRRGKGRRARHPRALGPHRIDRSEQRRQRRTVGRRPRIGRGQGRVLGHGRRADQPAEGDRVRRGVRALRRPRTGAQDAGARTQGGQAAARHVLREQRGYRRLAHGRRHRQQVHGLRLRPAVDVLRLERDDDGQRPRLRPDRGRAEGDGRRRSERPPSHHRHRQDDQGILADRVERQDRRARPIRSSATRAIRTR